MENFKEINDDEPKEKSDVNAEDKVKRPAYLPLPEEPKGVDRSLLCRVGVRLPDGRRVQRNFLRADPVQVIECSNCCVFSPILIHLEARHVFIMISKFDLCHLN